MAKNRSEEAKLQEELQSDYEIYGDVVEKVYNYERPQAFSLEAERTPPVDLFGYKVMNTQTGEVLATRRNWLQAVEQVGEPVLVEEVGEPLVVDFSKARDLKARAMSLLGTNSVASILGNDDNISDEDAFKALDDLNDNEADDFNEAMSQTPYACDENGVSNYEKAINQNNDELEAFRDYMSKKDLPIFQKVQNMPIEELERLINQAQDNKADIPAQEPME